MSWILNLICSFIATLGFAVFFNIPRKILVWVGLTGAVGWMLSIFLIQSGMASAWAYLLATMAVAFLAETFAIRTKSPSTLFSIPGIYPLVPGYALYRTMYFFTRNELDLGFQAMFDTLKNAGAIALGIIIMSSLGSFRKKVLEKRSQKNSNSNGKNEMEENIESIFE
ncbi:MAG: threonine/serine exporter family protein [Peptostreptococcaceae bacterium]|nr:threonine/serine exporter family protein [Peptostreptococcaceae bacterium]